MIVTTKIAFFQTYRAPSALRIDLFNSASGIPPSSVPAGQMSLQKYFGTKMMKPLNLAFIFVK